MNRNEILEVLKKIDKNEFNIEELGLFGSYAKEENTEDSDIDILVKLKFKKGMYQNFCNLQDYLTEKMDKEVDLIEKSSFKYKYKNEKTREFKEKIKQEILESVIYV
jgi:predicted nucleotidyltransferase